MHTERQPHVLIIDDQPEMLGSLIKMLENHQFRVSRQFQPEPVTSVHWHLIPM